MRRPSLIDALVSYFDRGLSAQGGLLRSAEHTGVLRRIRRSAPARGREGDAHSDRQDERLWNVPASCSMSSHARMTAVWWWTIVATR